jgi:hypothetical protein
MHAAWLCRELRSVDILSDFLSGSRDGMDEYKLQKTKVTMRPLGKVYKSALDHSIFSQRISPGGTLVCTCGDVSALQQVALPHFSPELKIQLISAKTILLLVPTLWSLHTIKSGFHPNNKIFRLSSDLFGISFVLRRAILVVPVAA